MQCAKQALVVVNFLLAQQLQPILHQWFPSKEFLSFLKLFVLIFLTETRYRLSSSRVNYISPGFNSWPEARLNKQFFFLWFCIWLYRKIPSRCLQIESKTFSPIFLLIHCHLLFRRYILHIKPMSNVLVNIIDYSVFITIVATACIFNLRSPTFL